MKRMKRTNRLLAAAASLTLLLTPLMAYAQTATLKIASPQRGSWEGAIPELGQQAGIFRKHGLELEILYTAGGGETLQTVVSGAVDVGLSAGTLSVMGAFQKGAPLRIIGASSSGSPEVFWITKADSPVKTVADAAGRTMSYSTSGASSHIAVMRFIEQFKVGAKPTATGSASATLTAVMTGQVDMGWAVAPFGLKEISDGKVRIVAYAKDIEAVRKQTSRVQIVNADIFARKRDLIERYAKAYNETLDWMYSSDDALKRYLVFSGFDEAAVRETLKTFIPKWSLQTQSVNGIDEAMEDAVKFKYLSKPLTKEELGTLIQTQPFAK
jgi:NitT/TauT family transport system substrate-binding protein